MLAKIKKSQQCIVKGYKIAAFGGYHLEGLLISYAKFS